jgi:hypothetical protein
MISGDALKQRKMRGRPMPRRLSAAGRSASRVCSDSSKAHPASRKPETAPARSPKAAGMPPATSIPRRERARKHPRVPRLPGPGEYKRRLEGVAGGDGGIRTLDTLLGYAHLANGCLQPLGHVSNGCPYAGSRGAPQGFRDRGGGSTERGAGRGCRVDILTIPRKITRGLLSIRSSRCRIPAPRHWRGGKSRACCRSATPSP